MDFSVFNSASILSRRKFASSSAILFESMRFFGAFLMKLSLFSTSSSLSFSFWVFIFFVSNLAVSAPKSTSFAGI